MTKFKLAAATGLAAAGIAVGGLVSAPSASAMPTTCETAMHMANYYITLGDIWLNVFNSPAQASAYYGRAQGLLEAAC